MDNMRSETVDMTKQNIEKIEALFPNVITEKRDKDGNLTKAINFDLLKQMLSNDINDISDDNESYEFTWVGKKSAIVDAHSPIRKTLRPCKEESKNWDTTENLYIEGDNLEVLKLLQESYLNKIKMIYIDPPYNTGNDGFVYPDNYTMDKDDYEEEIEYRDEDDNINFRQNNESNPRFHSDWCSMIYSRLKLARNLLSNDGSIAIQIDDNEVSNLKKICDEVFGSENFISLICIKMSHLSGMKMSHKDKKIPKIKEYILLYSRSKNTFKLSPIYVQGLWNDVLNRYTQFILNIDEDCSKWNVTPLSSELKRLQINSLDDAEKFKIQNARSIFRTAVNDTLNSLEKKKIFSKIITKTGLEKYVYNGEEVLFASSKLVKLGGQLVPAETLGDIWTDIGINNLHNEGGVSFQNGKKPVKLLHRLACMLTNTSDIILDFFSGSATTAHAVMKLNAEDGGNRKYIMVQLPEDCDEKSEAYKAGYKNICEIGKERIRRAGEKIQEEYLSSKKDSHGRYEDKKIPLLGRGGSEADGVVSNSRNSQLYFSLPYNPELKERARELRKAGNLSEVLLWKQIKNKQFKSLDFDRQKIIGNYIVDFYCASHSVVIEIDGQSYENKLEYDQKRDAYLESLGLEVIHIPDIDVKKNLDNVMYMLDNYPVFSRVGGIQNHPVDFVATPPQEGNLIDIPTPPQEGNLIDIAEHSYDGKVPDIGFRVFKVDESNMKDVFFGIDDYSQSNLQDLTENIKTDRSDLDLLYGILLEWGLPLSMSHKEERLDNCTIYTIQSGESIDLIACFDKKISENVITTIAKRQPLRVVFRDSSFATSADRINVEELFKNYSPDTRVKVL